ncbi:hypothetical protein TSOC_011464 [Tetrabaena socialis]|uniref:Membrane protein insertion efficiency factor n=1 Tax=Tetrabaena socialis TaxID=47790 RepID=A0A2J7ZQK4_9CHLO|nr:hypothetical protein TSOC_011464 [Tetrabaena socialis]|eukprot:PNH02547.1 hypothetical protein TSOC_011464 [Tetrabaena socialis]
MLHMLAAGVLRGGPAALAVEVPGGADPASAPRAAGGAGEASGDEERRRNATEGEGLIGNGVGSTAGGEGGGGPAAATPQEQPEGRAAAAGEEPPVSPGVRVALSLLAFYRGVLSPLMPSTCRFLPTCSNYSIESYKKYGTVRGTVLTAWRLLRCNPWGGRGYDPPAWPPVGLAPLYSVPYTPELTVVLGVALSYWLVTSTIDSLLR